jgi:hypothetical protein
VVEKVEAGHPSHPNMTETIQSEEPRVEKALEYIKSMLIPGETLEAWAIQRRLFALTHRRALIATTSGRFIGIQRGLFGGFTPVDIRWQDLRDAKVRVGIFGASVFMSPYNSSDLAVASSIDGLFSFTGLRKPQAQAVYRICQTQEQSWREKRRIRELDELRAQSGGVQISTGLQSAQQGAFDSVARLQQAKQMLDSKLITDSEYEAIKARIINGI